METQCKSCGSIKFEYKEGKKACAYCGREIYNTNYRSTTVPLKMCGYGYLLIDPCRTLTLIPNCLR